MIFYNLSIVVIVLSTVNIHKQKQYQILAENKLNEFWMNFGEKTN